MRSTDIYFITEKTKYSVTINAHSKQTNENVGYLVYEYFCDLDEEFCCSEDDKVVIIKFLEVFDKFKFKGFGSKLMEEFVKDFNKQNMVKKAVLEARPFNNDFGLPKDILMLFYNKFGFNETDFSTNNMTILEKLK